MTTINNSSLALLEVLTEASFLFKGTYERENWKEFLSNLENRLPIEILPIVKRHLTSIEDIKQKEYYYGFTSNTLELFHQINKEVTSLAPLEHILYTSSNSLRKISKANLVMVALLDQEEKVCMKAAAGAQSEKLLEFKQDIHTGVTGLVAKYKKPFVVSNLENEKYLVDSLATILIEKENIRSLIGAPLLVKDKLIGLVYLGRKRPYASSDVHIKMLTYYCSQVAIAINNARLYTNELRISELHRNIFEVALDQGYESIIQKLAEFINQPIMLMDEYGHIICSIFPSKGENKTYTEFEQHKEIYGKILHHTKQSLVETIIEFQHNHIFYTTFPVIFHERTVAYLVIPKSFDDQYDHIDFMAIEQTKNILSLIISKERTSTEVELRLRQDFLYDLIHGLESEEDLFRRGRHLNFSLEEHHQILVLSPLREESHTKQINETLEKIRYKLTGSGLPLSMVNGQRLIVSVPFSKTDKLARSILADFEKYSSVSNAVIGVSKSVAGLSGYKKAYEEAKKAAEFAVHFNKKGEIIHFDQLGIVGVMFEGNNIDSMKELCEKYLGTLINYKHTNGTDLIRSLQVFLDHESVIQSAAEELHVHYNTLRYRLKRIEEIIGLDLKDPQTKLNLRIALLIFRLLYSK